MAEITFNCANVPVAVAAQAFIEHNPDLLLSKICNAEYQPGATCKEWEKFLLEIMQGIKRKSSIYKRLQGYHLPGTRKRRR